MDLEFPSRVARMAWKTERPFWRPVSMTERHEIVVHRGLRRQVLGQRAPQAAGLQNMENPVHHLPHIHLAPTTACLVGLYSFEPG